MIIHNEVSGITAIANPILLDSRLSLKELGMFCTLASLIADKNYSINYIASFCKDGTTSVKSVIQALIEKEFLVPDPPANDNTVRIKYTTYLLCHPQMDTRYEKNRLLMVMTIDPLMTVLDNKWLLDSRLSLRGLGLLCRMMCLPEDFYCTTQSLTEICNEGITAVNSALQELERTRYLIRRKTRINGAIGKIQYIILDPFTMQKEKIFKIDMEVNQDADS